MVYFSRHEDAGEDGGSRGVGYFITTFGLSYQADILIGKPINKLLWFVTGACFCCGLLFFTGITLGVV
jgi:hypothetical protein